MHGFHLARKRQADAEHQRDYMDFVLPPKKRRELLHLLISASPYHCVLGRYVEEIDRVAAEHPQIAQIMAEIYSENSSGPRSLPRDPRSQETIPPAAGLFGIHLFLHPGSIQGDFP
jgi:hypothetical protein